LYLLITTETKTDKIAITLTCKRSEYQQQQQEGRYHGRHTFFFDTTFEKVSWMIGRLMLVVRPFKPRRL
jgi:hypothetical protein